MSMLSRRDLDFSYRAFALSLPPSTEGKREREMHISVTSRGQHQQEQDRLCIMPNETLRRTHFHQPDRYEKN